MTLDDIVKQKDYKSLYILARYFYRIGEPIIDDSIYNQLENMLKVKMASDGELAEFFNRTYDDDPLPEELLAKIGEKPIKFIINENRRELMQFLNEEKSLSMESVTTYAEAFEYFSMLRNNQLDFMSSLKVDGVNTKMLYEDGEFAVGMSRGRNAADSFDFTDACAKVMPHRMDANNQHHLKVTGESYVDKDAREKLRVLYNKPDGYATAKSSAVSMLRVIHKDEHYKWLHTRVFMAEGLADNLDTMFNKLEQQGFETVPHKLFSWRDIPEDYKEFQIWLKKNVFDYYFDNYRELPSDGIAIEVNDLSWLGMQHGQYSTRQLALKFEQWSYEVDSGIITGIKIEQRRVFKSVRVTIEPMRTHDGCKAEVINSFNPSILIKNDLYIGKHVYFEKNSGAVNILLHGKRLEEKLGKGACDE